jgi:hypothetical protein
MNNASQFVAPDPQKAMDLFMSRGRRAIKKSPEKMAALVEQDNARRDAERVANGEKKRGPKPKR